MKTIVYFIILMVWFPLFSADLTTQYAPETEKDWTNGSVILGVKRSDTTKVMPVIVGEDGCLQTNCYKNEVALSRTYGVSAGYKFGYGVVGITSEAIWDASNDDASVTDYNYITDDFANGTTLWISSDSTADDGTGTPGTGALSIEVYGLDTSYNEIHETVNLNGTATVETTNTYIRVYRAFVQKSGSTGYNAGNIFIHRSDVTSGTPDDYTKLYAKITSAKGQTLMSVYTVPSGYRMLVWKWTVGCGTGKQIEGDCAVRLFGTNTWRTRLTFVEYQNSRTTTFEYPIVIPEKADVEIHAKADTGTVTVDSTWFYLLIPNDS